MSCYSLPGITKIFMIDCADLPAGLMYQSVTGCVPALVIKPEPVGFIGRPILKWESENINGSPLEKSTLEFQTNSSLPEGRRLAFIVTAASGKQYIIGTREPKFPQISFSESTGSTGGDPAIRSYKVTHVARRSVIPCIF